MANLTEVINRALKRNLEVRFSNHVIEPEGAPPQTHPRVDVVDPARDIWWSVLIDFKVCDPEFIANIVWGGCLLVIAKRNKTNG